MAFQVTSFEAYAFERDEPLFKKTHQYLRLNGTALAADVALDIGNLSGTFWTAAIAGANAVTGAAALAALKSIIMKADVYLGTGGEIVGGGGTYAQVAGAPAANSTYQVSAMTNHVPSIAFNAANGPTTWTYVLTWILQNDQIPVFTKAP